MFQVLTHAKEQSGFVSFLSRALSYSNEEGITKWVRDKLLNEATKASRSTREAFFEAEKILIDSYAKTGNIDRVITLINAINGNDNQKLRKYQCDLLLLSLQEQRYVLHGNPGQQKKLQEFLEAECNKLKEEDKQEVSDEIATYLSDLKEVQGFHQKGI